MQTEGGSVVGYYVENYDGTLSNNEGVHNKIKVELDKKYEFRILVDSAVTIFLPSEFAIKSR